VLLQGDYMPPAAEPSVLFMLQEHSRMIDVYEDLHVQKNELLKLYLAFASIPGSIVVIFLSLYKYLDANPQLKSVLVAIQSAAVYLSILLVFVGFAVLMIMLRIRGEQYLYVQTVNAARKYFKEKHEIAADYLVLPTEKDQFTFVQGELSGRTFWEGMIVSFTTSMLLAFLSWQLAMRIEWPNHCSIIVAGTVFVASTVFCAWFIRSQLQSAIDARKLKEI
jgi:hypothetical protein